MNQIQNPPNEYDFGLEFNYALWTQDTRVTLVNVTWNNDYRDIVKFANRAALNSYIDSVENVGVVIENLSYVKPGQPIRIDVPFNAAYKYNYLRASNPVQPIGGDETRDFYYFVTDVRYVAPQTTELVLQLDVWQTFGYDTTFGNCYIERGHIGIANENAFNNYGRDYLTMPEGLDTGGEYRVIAKRREELIERITIPLGGGLESDKFSDFHILVATTTDLEIDPGTVDAPNLETARGGDFQYMPSGVSYWLFERPSNFAQFMTAYKSFPWITQGIMSISAVPKITRYYPEFEFDATVAPLYGGTRLNSGQGEPLQPVHDMFVNWRDSEEILNVIPARWRHLRKFFTYPYMAIEITTWTGTPVILKPESWANDDAKMLERAVLVPPAQRVTFGPRNYNAIAGAEVDSYGDDSGEYLDIATQIANFPSFAIVNNAGIAYLASNANSFAFAQKSAEWTQERARAGNELGYDQASSSIATAREMTDIGNRTARGLVDISNQAAWSGAMAGGIGQVAGGAGGGLVAGPGGAAIGGISGIGHAAMSGINVGISTKAATESQVTQAIGNIANNRAQTRNNEYVRDTNKQLADWAARGDYKNSIAALNARVQDAAMIQPTTAGQVGGESMNLVNGPIELSVRWKMLDPSAMRVIGDFWLRYGYAVNQFGTIPATLQVMTKFTYWKLTETYLSAAGMPEGFKQVIRGIFEKGVTVWANPADIGVIDIANNEPLEGITL